jgi:hypothetical protein
MRLIVTCFLACIALLVYADTPKDVLSDMVRCADVADPGERLKCFDAAVPRAKNALAEEKKATESKGFLDWFGFGRPREPVTKPEQFGKPAPVLPGGEINQITATVIEFGYTPRGKAIFILDNGHVWRQIDGDDVRVLEPDPGRPMKVTIEIGRVMENYLLTIEGRNAPVRVRRIK